MSDEEQMSGIKAALDAGARALEIEKRVSTWKDLETGSTVPIAISTLGRVEVIKDLYEIQKKLQNGPRRRSGCAVMQELGSFSELVNRFKRISSTIFADTNKVALVCVLNYHEAGPEHDGDDMASWCDHRVEYRCPLTPEWKAWADLEGDRLTQESFSDWIEEHQDDLTSEDGYPSPIDLIEMARDLRIHTEGTFLKRYDPANGTYEHVCKQEHTQESTKIPRAFVLKLQPFQGGAYYRVEALIRFTVSSGAVSFSFKLHQRDRILRDAFDDVCLKAQEATGLPLYHGIPEAPQ